MFNFPSILESEFGFSIIVWFLQDMDIHKFSTPSHASPNISMTAYLRSKQYTHSALAEPQRTFQLVWLSGVAGNAPMVSNLKVHF